MFWQDWFDSAFVELQTSLLSHYLFIANGKVLNDAFGLKIRVLKCMEKHSVLVACISVLPFITVLTLLFKREGIIAMIVATVDWEIFTIKNFSAVA